MEFHIATIARDKYQFDQAIFSKRGNVIFGSYRAAQEFSEKIKAGLNSEGDQKKISAGDIFAMGLLDEIYHLLIEKYRIETFPKALSEGN